MPAEEPSEPVVPASLQSSNSPTHRRAYFLSTKNLSLVIVGVILIYAMYRADTKDIPKIVEIVFESHVATALGWGFAVMILAIAVVFHRLSAAIYEKEIARITKERDRLQELLLNRRGEQ
jgi:hypothetical protein